jgi:hypothetical protein
MYIIYIFFVFFLVANTTRSAGTFKLGPHNNREEGACIHNFTKPCISKTHWLQIQNTHTEREKIKKELSDKHTQPHIQKVSQGTQNHEKNYNKNKIKEEKNNDNTNTLICHILECDKVLKNENKIKKYEKNITVYIMHYSFKQLIYPSARGK